MTLTEELELVEQAKTNIQSFAKIYDYYFLKIYAFALNRVGIKETAEDITAEVFLIAVDAIKKFDTSKNIKFGSWLYSTCHNKIVDHFRKNKRNIDILLEKNLVSTNNAEDFANLSQRKYETITTLKTLKSEYQLIIGLRFFSEMEISEISEILNKKPTQISVDLFRALQSFKKNFQKNFPQSEIFDI